MDGIMLPPTMEACEDFLIARGEENRIIDAYAHAVELFWASWPDACAHMEVDAVCSVCENFGIDVFLMWEALEMLP